METEDRDGTTVADLPADSARMARRRRRRAIIGAVGGLLALLLAVAGWLLYDRLTERAPERFVVLIAPFSDGGDGQTGLNVAQALARQISQRAPDRVTVAVLDRAPADTLAAMRLAEAQGSDLLIWGSVDPGGMLDDATLRPRLIYTPNGPYAPNGWDGYVGRFAMPRSYTLASEPINGQAALTPLILALFDYSRGAPDQAFVTLGQLADSYPALTAPLPRALRGNVLWARGSYAAAAAEYRLALAAPSDDQALLANNLGAILLDAGDPGMLAAFDEAVRLLAGSDLGELRYNLGLLDLRNQNPANAIIALEQARNLLPGNTPLLLSLAEAYRESGRLANADQALSAASSQSGADQRLATADYRQMLGGQLAAAIDEQRGLLGLARSVAAQGPLTWELEIARPQPEGTVASLRDMLNRAADASALAVARWHQRSASDSVSNPDAGLVAAGQADRIEAQARRQTYELALLDVELARAQAGRPRSALGQMFGALFGGRTPIATALDLLGNLDKRTPNSPTILLATARAQRNAGLLDEADRTYAQVVQIAPQRPEGYFGQGMIALDRGDGGAAAQLLGSAVERNGDFFPARVQLAALAERNGDWAGAIDQLRALAAQRPGPSDAIALAQALRRSGPTGYIEAERVLVPLSGQNVDATIELGRLYSDAGRNDEAVKAYRDALALDPRSSTASYELGERLAAAGDLKGAEQALRDALRFDDGNTAARLALGRLYEGPLAQPAQADREYGVALSQGVNDVNALVAIGDAAMQNANPGQAISAYTRATTLAPDNPLPQHRLAQAYLQTNRLQAASDAEQQVLAQTGDTANAELRALRAEALVTLGDVARRRADLPQASDYYAQALQLDPNLIAAQIGQGQVAVGQGQWGVALGYFEAAARLPGGDASAQAQFWLAEGLLRSGDLGRATTAYNQALAIQPTFPEALLGLAQVQYTQQNAAAAMETVQRSLGQRPAYAEALLFRGKLYQEQGQLDQALNSYNAAIRASSQIAEAYYRRGTLLIRNEKYADAASDLRQAVQLQPNFPEANYWLGRAYYAQNRLESARDAFKRAVDLNAGYSEALYYLGLTAEDMGRRDEAIVAYQTVLQSDGAGEWGARARAQLDRIQ
jgi:tetratricopeptide (TPR) repeat protein